MTTTYEIREPCPVELRHQIAAIVAGARRAARIEIDCREDHGEHVAVVNVSEHFHVTFTRPPELKLPPPWHRMHKLTIGDDRRKTARDCPPCSGDCEQGRRCPARAKHGEYRA